MRGGAKIARRILGQFWRPFWRGLREWCGDAAYDRYLHWAAQRKSTARSTLTAEQFYVDQLNRRYSRPNRCC
jgi:uncharacterized short protein YbdD (DUF466 family)